MTNGKKDTIGQLTLTARAVRTAFTAELSAMGLHAGQETVLLTIAEKDGIALRSLADLLAVRPPTITKTIARLSAQGLVEKRASKADARQSHVFLTDAGRAIVGDLEKVRKRVQKSALSDLSDKERKALRKLLKRVEANLFSAK
ncbi:MAG: winged helix-turn-helix transcriptional regulator [Fulvimarina manganoxydans]|uniref:MarR family winged helix-turn-helix transcriptional regulator n=1 Tax=Fulvimarina manganoxydans TaxID=937218 RepID=UPI0023545339|nr:MarR family winged helix-turn-helix transcriptional regulator [Fulvimarina manganoxydans]MCK5931096.1 winged helix-turn-helix transcriptional regulator [Fulvimarina manganoxydans]